MKNRNTEKNDSISYNKLLSPQKRKYFLYEDIFYIILSIYLILYHTVRMGFICYTLAEKYNFNLDGLTEGYSFLGGHRDFSDYQWRYFRQNLWLLTSFAIIFCTISKIIKNFTKSLFLLKIFYLIMGLSFSFLLHRIKMIYLIIVLFISFLFCKYYSVLGKKFFIAATWIFCILIKVTSEIYEGYDINFINWPKALKDSLLDWQTAFGLIMLKIISFNVEFSHIYDKDKKNNYIQNITEIKKHCDSCSKGKFCLKALKFINADISDFSFVNYLIYIFYPPFYLAGPNVMYHSFIFQLKNINENKHNEFFDSNKLFYIVRTIFIFIVLEVFNHFIYVNALLTNKFNKQILQENDLCFFDLFFLAFNDLVFLWLKFSLIWKIARLWGWIDGILAEENMNRCIYNNYCFEGFWRAWHRSYNVWLIRYIYVPLGGKNKKLLNTFVVFTFVALWHDLRWHLLIWGWFIYVFIVPEIVVKSYFAKEKLQYLNYCIWFRYLRAAFSSFYVILMIIANLIGFGVGSEEVVDVLFKLLKKCKLYNFIYQVIFFMPMVIVMYYMRGVEEQKGKAKNY